MEKRILLCTNEYPPDHGGVARYLSGLVAHAASPVTVVRVALTARWFTVFNVLWNATDDDSRIREVWCSHIFPIGTACYLLSLVRRIPYVLYFHGMDIERVAQGRVWKRWLARLIVARAKSVYANSQYTESRVEQVTGRSDVQIHHPKIEPLPESLQSSPRLHVGLSETDTVLLCVARLVLRKGVDRILRALACLPPSVVLVVIGDGPERTALEQLAKEQHVENRVRWLGAVDDSTTYAWYQAADIFVLLPRLLPADVEGFGMVYIEAGWYGLPVVATDTGGISDAVVDGETGVLVRDTDDPAVLARCIDTLVQDTSVRTRMGEKAQSRVRQHFVWNEPKNHS